MIDIPGKDPVATIDHWIAAEEFGHAEKLLHRLDDKGRYYRDLAVRKRAMRPLIEQFEQRQIDYLETLRQKDQWQQAFSSLDDAIRRAPQSARLDKYHQLLTEARQQRLRQLEDQLQVLRASRLPAENKVLEQMAQVDPTAISTRWKRFWQQRKANDLAEDLAECGEEEMRVDAKLAAQCLKLAQTIAPDPQRQKQLARLEGGKVGSVSKATLKLEQKSRQRQLKQIKQDYQDLIAAGWWVSAREKMIDLQVLAPSDPQVIAWGKQLSRELDIRTTRGIKAGQQLYSQGKLREALDVWKKARALSPDNSELQSNIARVQRFLAKLQKLETNDGFVQAQ